MQLEPPGLPLSIFKNQRRNATVPQLQESCSWHGIGEVCRPPCSKQSLLCMHLKRNHPVSDSRYTPTPKSDIRHCIRPYGLTKTCTAGITSAIMHHRSRQRPQTASHSHDTTLQPYKVPYYDTSIPVRKTRLTHTEPGQNRRHNISHTHENPVSRIHERISQDSYYTLLVHDQV